VGSSLSSLKWTAFFVLLLMVSVLAGYIIC